ncbi:MAG: DUF3592 domain-containing protein [Planctomycetota bacterium]|nr:MAG: DUF3592 domain-containing protein [Planctomycetota bacterium]
MRIYSSTSTTAYVMLVIAILLALIGFGMLRNIAVVLINSRTVSTWQETPATITTLRFGSDDEDSASSQRLFASYEYEHAGQRYVSTAIDIYGGGSSKSPHYQRLYNRLQESREQGVTVCYVNPAHPQRAILDPTFTWRRIQGEVIAFIGFGGIGGLFAVVAILDLRRRRQVKRVRQDQPKLDWRAHGSWEDGPIPATRDAQWVMVSVAIVWNLFGCAAIYFNWDHLFGDEVEAIAYVIWLFPLIGWGMLAYILYVFMRMIKFGRPQLQLARMPLILGKRYASRMLVRNTVPAKEVIYCRIICGKSVMQRDGQGSRQLVEHVLWEHHWVQPPTDLKQREAGTTLDMRLPLPVDAPEMDSIKSIAWRLEVHIPCRGIDFIGKFPLPVVQGEAVGNALTSEKIKGHGRSDVIDKRLQQLCKPGGILIHGNEAFLSVTTSAMRMHGGAITSMVAGLIALLVGGIISYVFIADSFIASFLVVAVLGGVGVWLLTYGARLYFWERIVEVDRHGITFQTGFLRARRCHYFRKEDIDRIIPTFIYDLEDHLLRRITLMDYNGHTYHITGKVGRETDAWYLINCMRGLMGLAPVEEKEG